MRPFLQQVTLLCFLLLCLLILACNSGNDNTLSNDVNQLITDFDKLEDDANSILTKLQTKSYKNPDNLPSITAQVEDVKGKIADTKRVITRNQKENNLSEAKVSDWKLDYTDIEQQLNVVKNQELGLIAIVKQVKDSDKDGVPDDIDQCLTERGPARNNGCPEKKIETKTKNNPPKQVALNKPKPVVSKPATPPPARIRDTDGDGLLDNVDKCPNEYGTGSDGCPPKFVPPPPPASTNYTPPVTSRQPIENSRPAAIISKPVESTFTKPKEVKTIVSEKPSSTFGSTISCNSANSFSPINAGSECSEIEKSSGLTIRPNKNVAFSSFYLVGDDNGTIEYKLTDDTGKKLNKRNSGRVNAGPGMSQMSTGNIQLKANKNYKLIVKPNGKLKLKTHSCDKGNFGHADVELTFSGEPFVHQINFCK